MADYERRHHGPRGGRKRRYRGENVLQFNPIEHLTLPLLSLFLLLHYSVYECSLHGTCSQDSRNATDDDDYDRRQRRRYEEPLFVKVRRQLLSIAESVRISYE